MTIHKKLKWWTIIPFLRKIYYKIKYRNAWKYIKLPNVSQVHSSLPLKELVEVQPMTKPIGLDLFVDFTYNGQYVKGDTLDNNVTLTPEQQDRKDRCWKLRNRSGMGIMDCRKALEVSDWDEDKAYEILLKKMSNGCILITPKKLRDITHGKN